MTLEADVTTAIKAVTAKAHADVAPPKTTPPYAVYQGIGGRSLRWLDNTAADKRNTLMQISVWATTRAQATLLAHQIEEAMCASDDFTATPQGEPISTHDAETNLYGAVQRYSIYSLR